MASLCTETARGSGFEQTAQAQARLIDKLESDIAHLHKEIQQLRNKYEKKVKRVRVSSAKQKAEASLQVFALKVPAASLSLYLLLLPCCPACSIALTGVQEGGCHRARSHALDEPMSPPRLFPTSMAPTLTAVCACVCPRGTLPAALQEQLSKMSSDYALVQTKLQNKQAELERATTPAPVERPKIPQRPQTPREQQTDLVVMLSAQIEDLEDELHQANSTIDELRGDGQSAGAQVDRLEVHTDSGGDTDTAKVVAAAAQPEAKEADAGDGALALA